MQANRFWMGTIGYLPVGIKKHDPVLIHRLRIEIVGFGHLDFTEPGKP
jgi:hypothetical protein